MSPKPTTETRQRLLDAATRTLRRQGLHALTLSAIAKEAGVSKGGLLHHFPSKDALSRALLEQLFADFEARVRGYLELEGTPGRWLRAYVRATFEEDPLPLEVVTMLLVAVSENRALQTLITADSERWQRRLLADGVEAARATVIRCAADAQWSERLLTQPDPAARRAVMDELLRLSRDPRGGEAE